MEKIDFHVLFQGKQGYELFTAPKPGQSVWPHQGCPCWTARPFAMPAHPQQECWYCVHADFHLDRDRALDVGICQYPEKFKNR